MHELSVTEALLDLAVEHGRAAQARRISTLYLVIGQLSSVIDESVQFYWDLISAGTLAEGARLSFRRVPALFRCAGCGNEYGPAAEVLACQACGSLSVDLIAGDEFYLEALDIDPLADSAALADQERAQ